MCDQVCTPVYKYRGQRTHGCPIFFLSSSFSWERVLSLNPELAILDRLAGHQDPVILLSQSPQHWAYRYAWPHRAFYINLEDLNSGLMFVQYMLLPTEPSSPPLDVTTFWITDPSEKITKAADCVWQEDRLIPSHLFQPSWGLVANKQIKSLFFWVCTAPKLYVGPWPVTYVSGHLHSICGNLAVVWLTPAELQFSCI